MKLEPLQYRSESPVQGMSDRQQESRGFNPVRKSSFLYAGVNKLRGFYAASDSWSAMFACRMRFSMSSVFLCTRLKRMVSTGPDNGRYSTSK